jgi:hypothetical protein
MRKEFAKTAAGVLAATALGLANPLHAQAPPPSALPSVPLPGKLPDHSQFRPVEREGVPDAAQVELAWLADPATFSCHLGATVVGNTLEIKGYVPNDAVRARAVKLAEQQTSLAVVDHLQLQTNLAVRSGGVPVEELQQAVTEALALDFGSRAASIQTAVRPGGQVTLDGTIPTWQEKLAISRRLQRVHGCMAVINRLGVKSAGSSTPPLTPDTKTPPPTALPEPDIKVPRSLTPPESVSVVPAKLEVPTPPPPPPPAPPEPVSEKAAEPNRDAEFTFKWRAIEGVQRLPGDSASANKLPVITSGATMPQITTARPIQTVAAGQKADEALSAQPPNNQPGQSTPLTPTPRAVPTWKVVTITKPQTIYPLAAAPGYVEGKVPEGHFEDYLPKAPKPAPVAADLTPAAVAKPKPVATAKKSEPAVVPPPVAVHPPEPLPDTMIKKPEPAALTKPSTPVAREVPKWQAVTRSPAPVAPVPLPVASDTEKLSTSATPLIPKEDLPHAPLKEAAEVTLLDHLKQQVEDVCGKRAGNVEIEIISQGRMTIRLDCPDNREVEALAKQILQLRELGPFEVTLDVNTAP